MSQKEIFLNSEGDAWFERNKDALTKIDPEVDPLILEIKNLMHSKLIGKPEKIDILEVGCGDGTRSKFISDLMDCNVYGIDPSQKAVKAAVSKGIMATEGTAEKLPYQDDKFDLLIYGFCLYLCDREDLINIAKEASRVMKDDSWLVIMDFYSDDEVENSYSHLNTIKSFKMDYRKIFERDGAYVCYSHKLIDHETHKFTDIKENWMSISLMRKVKQ